MPHLERFLPRIGKSLPGVIGVKRPEVVEELVQETLLAGGPDVHNFRRTKSSGRRFGAVSTSCAAGARRQCAYVSRDG
jgi:hypothetical protein